MSSTLYSNPFSRPCARARSRGSQLSSPFRALSTNKLGRVGKELRQCSLLRRSLPSGKTAAVADKEKTAQSTERGPNPRSTSPDVPLETGGDESGNQLVKVLGAGAVVGGLASVGGLAYIYQDQIRSGLSYFTSLVDEWGPLGYVAYMGVYTGLEVLAVPAIPLTMTAGVLFGTVPGTAMVSVCATTAATISFLIARYFARAKVQEWVQGNRKFEAIDAAVSAEGLKVVILLRLSPLLPLAASNYLYGLTGVSLQDYVLGSWLGMLPGTLAYVTVGDMSKSVINGGSDAGGLDVGLWQGLLAVGITTLAVAYIGRIAQDALSEIEDSYDEDDYTK